jgi:hypothetical protein
MTAEKITTIRLTQIGDDRRVPAKLVLKQARAEKLDEVLVIGRTDDGELWSSSSLNAGQSLWLIEKLRERLLRGNPWSIV